MIDEELLKILQVRLGSTQTLGVVRETMRDGPGQAMNGPVVEPTVGERAPAPRTRPGRHDASGRATKTPRPNLNDALSSAPTTTSQRAPKQDPAGDGGAGRRRRPAAKVRQPRCGLCDVFVRVMPRNDQPARCSRGLHWFFERLAALYPPRPDQQMRIQTGDNTTVRRDLNAPAALPLDA